jgi:transcriptional regulator with XRE-family HTH domain
MRNYHHLTQTELAKRLEISNSYLCEIEAGDKTPGLEILNKYSAIFKIPTSSILLFAEALNDESLKAKKLRFAAAEKVIRLLEWIDERDAVQHE